MADQQASSPKPWWVPDLQATVAVAIVLLCGAALFWRMTHPSNVDDKQLDTMLTIMFSTALVAIVNFLFGSSRMSQSQSEALSTIAAMPVPPAPTLPAPAPTPNPTPTPQP